MKQILVFFTLFGIFLTSGGYGATSCPAGYIGIDIPDALIFTYADTCPAGSIRITDTPHYSTTTGVGYAYNQLCTHGIKKLAVRNGNTTNRFYLFNTKTTNPSLVFQIGTDKNGNAKKCYGNLYPGTDRGNGGTPTLTFTDGIQYYMGEIVK